MKKEYLDYHGLTRFKEYLDQVIKKADNSDIDKIVNGEDVSNDDNITVNNLSNSHQKISEQINEKLKWDTSYPEQK